METLGSLIDKLIVVKLKGFHTSPMEREKNESLCSQEFQLRNEINEYILDVMSGKIPIEKLHQASNKVYSGVIVPKTITHSVGASISQLAMINNDLWHQQEKVYEFKKVPPALKDEVIEQLAILNLQRTKCIEEIDRQFKDIRYPLDPSFIGD
jgi:hypothetical protein